MQLFSAKQGDVLVNADARWNILTGAISSGKTYCSYDLTVKRTRTLPEGNMLMTGKTERTLRRNVLNPMRERYGRRYVSEIHGDGEVTIFGRTLYVAGANDERSLQKIQGLTLVYASCDEMATYPESFLQMLRGRLRVPGACCDGTCNPEGPFHHFKEHFIDRAVDPAQRTKVWHFRIDDNPFLDPEYVASMKAEYTGVWYKRMIEGQWCAAEGAVYDMFNPAVGGGHVITAADLPRGPGGTLQANEIFAGADYATGNPTAFLLCARHFGTVYVLKEYYWDSKKTHGQKTDAQYSRDFAAFVDGVHHGGVAIDPSAASFILQMRNDGALVRQANNSVLDGIRRVANLLQAGRLKIVGEECPMLTRELSSYVWDPNAQKIGIDRPKKEFDHACDALRYAVNTFYRIG